MEVKFSQAPEEAISVRTEQFFNLTFDQALYTISDIQSPIAIFPLGP